MSGAEVFAVLGVISAVISIIDKSMQLYDAAQNATGLHEAFRKVAENMPVVLRTLKEAHQVQETLARSSNIAYNQDIEKSDWEVKPIFVTCETNVELLGKIFEKVVPADEESRLEHYRKVVAIVLPGKKKKVEELMKEILEKLQLLHTYQFFRKEVSNARL